MNDPRRYWFPAKRYGWGWGLPSTWQGWVVLLAFVVSLAVSARRLLPQDPARFGLVAVITSVVFIAICYVKGEPPTWRWGNDK
jgi:uncharacterized membrane protein YhaH (DUF805 family)